MALMLVWAVHNGGYDPDTWYWGALLTLATLGVTLVAGIARAEPLSRPARIALTAFALYLAFSYLSIAWSQSPGDALEGSNRTLLYFLLFSLLLLLPWDPQSAVRALILFALGVGVIAFGILVRLAGHENVQSLLIQGRLASPTGYINATACLFTIDALTSVVLACRRELPALLRGTLLAAACASLQTAIIVQSRGWLFTLPLVLIGLILLVPGRLRLAAGCGLVGAASLASVHRLLAVYESYGTSNLGQASADAGTAALIACAAVLVGGWLIAAGEDVLDPRPLDGRRRRQLGAVAAILALGAGSAGVLVTTHGHPVRFVERQWNGFSHETSTSAGSHFLDIGSSGRYDFWRVSLDAFTSHPWIGLGQDNFADYYLTRRHLSQEPKWTHSLELRLLVHTGLAGLVMFVVFLGAAVTVALRGRRGADPLVRAVTAASLVPLLVWIVHGSLDWFWEMPALTGPALGFLAIAGALGEPYAPEPPPRTGRGGLRIGPLNAPVPALRWAGGGTLSFVAGALAFGAATVVLAFPYLAVRETSTASDIGTRNPVAALADLHTAARLNPLSAAPDRLAGSIALQHGLFNIAEDRFSEAVARERQGWFGWFGDGLAASALGDAPRAYRDYLAAERINSRQPAIRDALRRVYTTHPLTPAEAFRLLVVVQ